MEIKCSVCKEKAKKLIEVIWKGKQIFYPRCIKHIVKGYEGLIIEINSKNFATAKTNNG